MKFKDIPQMTRDGNYRINLPWDLVEDWISRERAELKLDLDPDFQRAHVWTEAQQRAYVEFKLRGGVGSNEIRLNCAGWMTTFKGPFVLVDGKQRLEAVRKFMRDELTVFDGLTLSAFEDIPAIFPCDFIVCVNNLSTRAEYLQWYLDINTGGVVHTEEDIAKVHRLLTEAT